MPPLFQGPGPEIPVAKVVPVAPPPPPPPDFVVTGVVLGERSVAILRGQGSSEGGEERRFVRVADPVGNGFQVSAILRGGVEIRSGKRRVILKLGGDSRAKK